MKDQKGTFWGDPRLLEANKENPRPEYQRIFLQAMNSEKHVTAGWLSQSTRFELIVTGPYDVRQIDCLIRKLELDRQILMDGSTHTARISENTGTPPVDTSGKP